MASILPALQRAAPRLTRQFFQYSHQRLPIRQGACPAHVFPKASPKSLKFFSSSHLRSSAVASNTATAGLPLSNPEPSIGGSTRGNGAKASRRYFPNTSQKVVAYWLLGSAASVFGIVVFGGLTRLTESGYKFTVPARHVLR